jgi:hypothetical protein
MASPVAMQPPWRRAEQPSPRRRRPDVFHPRSVSVAEMLKMPLSRSAPPDLLAVLRLQWAVHLPSTAAHSSGPPPHDRSAVSAAPGPETVLRCG